MRNIAILGSTGSIGTQTLDIVRRSDELHVCALSANNSIDLLEKQIREFLPDLVCVYNPEKANELKENIKDLDVKVVSGEEGLIDVATIECSDILVTAIVGMIGIRPTVAAIKAKKDIALANKETLVCAGQIITNFAKVYGVKIYPVDSEHSAIFQSLQGNENNRIEKVLLTCSGGAFRSLKKEQLKDVTVKDALVHPTWSMGKKITVDCATLVNKGLEVMEASWLFNVSIDQVQVIIHPESIVHSMVQYEDGAIMAELGSPDMRVPIEYALYYPRRKALNTKRLDFWEINELHFGKPDIETFEGLPLAYEAARKGGSMPALFNAANEYAVEKFLNNEIKFLEIYEIIKKAMSSHQVISNPTLDEIINIKDHFTC